MTTSSRKERLIADQRAMELLKSTSTILDIRSVGSPPDRYTLLFRGRGLSRDVASGEVRAIENHECDIRLPWTYPQRAPELRWQTPLFHPNISFGGFIRLEDIGITWSDTMGLEILCERLWDVARLAYVNLPEATNYAAEQWLQTQHQWKLPVDRRPLCDDLRPTHENVIRYGRRDGRKLVLPPAEVEEDVLYIDDTTPLPPVRARRRQSAEDAGVWYIGE